MEPVSKHGLPLLVSPALQEHTQIVHAFTTRLGGVSRGSFATLNLGTHAADDPSCVSENRSRLAAALGVDMWALVVPRQVHGAVTAAIGRASCAPVQADALVSDVPGRVLCVGTADCVSILVYDPVRIAVAAVHAGWRGTAQQIAREALGQMGVLYDTRPRDCWAALGPAIGPCCYEVGEEVALALPSEAVEPLSGGKYRADLAGANVDQLVAAGVPPDHIDRCDWCTGCRADLFFSHRRDAGTTGRMMATIGIRSGDGPPPPPEREQKRWRSC